MKKEIMLELTQKAVEIGSSSKHYASVSLITLNSAFPVTIYIHSVENGMSNGIVDNVCFSRDESLELHSDWLRRWEEIIAKEREEDAANKS